MTAEHLDYVSSAYVISDGGCVLLVDHPTLHLWLPPGGHIESGETPQECAEREVWEETGVEIDVVSSENQSRAGFHDGEPIRLLHLPITVQYERIEDRHFHVNFIYAARPGRQSAAGRTKAGAEWVSLDRLEDRGASENVIMNAFRAQEITHGASGQRARSASGSIPPVV